MLIELHIENYAIIESVDLKLNPHWNVIIGETGAGKSILMGALSLVLGNRADTQVLLDKSKKCTIEATLYIQPYSLEYFFEENDLDYSDQTIIRRDINPNGKSRAFINDIPVTLDVLKSFTSHLIDIHAQHENSQLMNEVFFIQLLDRLSAQQNLETYKKTFHIYLTEKKKLAKYKEEAADFVKEYDFVKYQFEELNQFHISEEYWNEVEDEYNMLSNADMIQNALQISLNNLSDQEINTEFLLSEVQRSLQATTKFHSKIEEFHQEIEDIQIKIKSISREIQSMLHSVDANEEKLNELQEYQSNIMRLQQKHHVRSIQELVEIYNRLKEKLEQFSFSDEHIQQLEKSVKTAYERLIEIAQKISNTRKLAAKKFADSITEVVKDLGMPFAKVDFSFEKLQNPNEYGIDNLQLLFAPNKGSQFQSLQQVGSGGEKSRLMLAIKSLVAKETALPTLIFDEIDTGISGEVAIQTGELLKKISKNHQVISITHLPQIAAAGSQHFLVYKEHLENKSITKIKTLNPQETIGEIAKMISGNQPTPAAIENAKNLIEGKN